MYKQAAFLVIALATAATVAADTLPKEEPMIPLRQAVESLGAFVNYSPGRKTVTVIRRDHFVEFTLGSKQAMVDEKLVYLPKPVVAHNGQIWVPMAMMSRALGFQTAPNGRLTTLPDPAPGPVAAVMPGTQTAIFSVTHNATGTLLQGDLLRVTLLGAPEGQAFFDIPGIVHGVPMREVTPGRYEGGLRITEALRSDYTDVVGRLLFDNQESLKLASSQIALDGRIARNAIESASP